MSVKRMPYYLANADLLWNTRRISVGAGWGDGAHDGLFQPGIRENGSSSSILAQMREGKPVEALLRAPCSSAPLVENAVRTAVEADQGT
jgi:hypothetical protein